MVLQTTDTLATTLRELGLLEADRLEELTPFLSRFANPGELADHLVRQRVLTPFQANRLLHDRGKELLLGPYLLLERLGTGGMGEVFKARHRKMRRIVAVKVIQDRQLGDPLAVQRFLREAEAAARLSHPNIVAVHDAGEHGGIHFLAMEFIDGIDLGQLLIQTGPLPVWLACDLIRQAALGLQHAHDQGIVHRDIKPANLLVAPPGRSSSSGKTAHAVDEGPIRAERFLGGSLKILDMGLAQIRPASPEDADVPLTQQGALLGTMDYLAPEQARNPRTVDHRADQYALGCTLYHLLTGKPPFPGGLPVDKILRHQSERPPLVGSFRPDIPSGLQELLDRLMAREPQDRFASAAEVAERLANLLASMPCPTFSPPQVRPTPPASLDHLPRTRIVVHQAPIYSTRLTVRRRRRPGS